MVPRRQPKPLRLPHEDTFSQLKIILVYDTKRIEMSTRSSSLQGIQTALQASHMFLQRLPLRLPGFPIVVLQHLIEGCLLDTKVSIEQMIQVRQ